MTTRAAVPVLLVASTGFLGHTAVAMQPDGLKLSAAVVGDRPLPCQAVRLLVVVENTGPKPATGLLPLENTVRVVRVTKGGKDVRPAGHIDLLTELRVRGPIDSLGPTNRSLPVTLAAGERRAVTFPVGVRRTADGVEPLFPAPGTYVLRCQYVYGTRTPRNAPPEGAAGEELSLFAEATVEVGKPDKKDEPWAQALARDPGLAVTLLSPETTCTAARAAVLRELIEKAPESAYVNYGRLAVARFHLIGDHDPRYSPRVNRAFAADVLERAISKLDYAGFPFNPHVYLNLMEAAPEYKAAARLTLNHDYQTAMEWIEVVAPTMTPEQWAKFRNRPARKDESKPPPDPEKPR